MVVMGATLASTVLGFGREVVNARFFGANWQYDVFLAALVVPTILFGVFNGALVTALVPLFSDYVNTDREDEAWNLASSVIVSVFVVLSACAVAGALLAPWYVPLIARFPHGHAATAVAMTRWLMPTIVATSLAGVIAALLNAYHRFMAAAVQGLVANLCVVGFVSFLQPRYGPYALVFGSLAGAFAQLFAMLPAFFALRRFHVVVDVRQPGDGTVNFVQDNDSVLNGSVPGNDKEWITAGPRPAGVTAAIVALLCAASCWTKVLELRRGSLHAHR